MSSELLAFADQQAALAAAVYYRRAWSMPDVPRRLRWQGAGLGMKVESLFKSLQLRPDDDLKAAQTAVRRAHFTVGGDKARAALLALGRIHGYAESDRLGLWRLHDDMVRVRDEAWSLLADHPALVQKFQNRFVDHALSSRHVLPGSSSTVTTTGDRLPPLERRRMMKVLDQRTDAIAAARTDPREVRDSSLYLALNGHRPIRHLRAAATAHAQLRQARREAVSRP